MRQIIPQRVEITCDRCKKTISEEETNRVDVNPNHRDEEVDIRYDLCPLCLAAFHMFISKGE